MQICDPQGAEAASVCSLPGSLLLLPVIARPVPRAEGPRPGDSAGWAQALLDNTERQAGLVGRASPVPGRLSVDGVGQREMHTQPVRVDAHAEVMGGGFSRARSPRGFVCTLAAQAPLPCWARPVPFAVMRRSVRSSGGENCIVLISGEAENEELREGRGCEAGGALTFLAPWRSSLGRTPKWTPHRDP